MSRSIATVVVMCGGLALLACSGKGGSDDGDAEGGSETTSLTGITTTVTTTVGAETTTDGGSMTVDTSATDATATGTGGGDGAACGGTVYACGNGMDDDGDGLIDLMDPECTGPCDDLEGSFQTGIPGDNMDCKQDCFFDGDSGSGNDGCEWDLRCDPANPGANVGCEYTGGNNCGDEPVMQSQECIDFCTQFVPPGCDCFGCCTVEGPDGPIDIFLNSDPNCSLDNLEVCESCTKQEDCSDDCDPANCEICFGETELPEGCDENTCSSGMACMDTAECAPDYFCYLGCCYPPPQG